MFFGINKIAVTVITIAISTTLVGCDQLGLFGKKAVEKKQEKVTTTPVAAKAAPETTGELPKDVMVRVGDWSLTQGDFDARLAILKEGLPEFNQNDPSAKQMVFDELVRQQLLVKDAKDQGIDDQKDIKDAVEDFRNTLMVQELANRLTKDIVATDVEAQKYYDENKELFREPTKWKVREIVVADEATAKNTLVQVLQGTNFAQTAQSQSKGKTAAQGGLLPDFTNAPFAAMQAAIANLENGGTSSVFKGPDGFYIVHVDQKSGGALKTFVEVKKELIAGLTLRKQQSAVLEHLNDLAEKHKVEVNQDLVGSMLAPTQK